MNKHHETMPDRYQVVRDVPSTIEEGEMKIPRAVIRVTSSDNSHRTSPKYTLVRQLGHGREQNDENEAPPVDTNDMRRYDETLAHSPKEYALNNGLDPIGIELISSTTIPVLQAGSEYSDKSDDILDYLASTNESPRRSRKNKDTPLPDPDEGLDEEIVLEGGAEQNIELHPISTLNDGGESDTTVIRAMVPPRRRSIVRSRSTSRSRTPKKLLSKSMARLLKDELSLPTDKDENHEEEEEDRTSETSFVSNRSLEGRTVNPPPKPGWDSFCFKCHTDSQVLSLACSKCKCSYHRQCVRPNPIPKNAEEFICPECIEVENALDSEFNKYGHEKIDLNSLAELLTIILEKIRTYQDRELFENEIVVKGTKELQSLIVNQMSLKTLETRIKSHHYKVTESFIHDIKQLEHNWNIVDRNKTKSLKSIVKYVYTEVNELEACVFCYQRSFVTGDWFIQPCERPHLLIWAKLKGYPYWPAKVMSVDARQYIDVRFFGAHDRAWVPAAHCILFCEQDPNKTKGSTPTGTKSNSKSQKGIADAIKEKDWYIKNLREKFGFRYFKYRETFDPSTLQKHLEYMLPALKNLNDSREAQYDAADIECTQKEKLTLKIVKGQSSNYQVEHKQTEKSEKSKPQLYKVLSKSDDNADMEQPAKLSLIIKRKSNVEQETEKVKRSKTNENTSSESSEGNVMAQNNKLRRKSPLIPTKHKKAAKNIEKDAANDTPPPAKKSKQIEKQKNIENEENLLEDVAKTKRMSRRVRAEGVLPEPDQPLLVPSVVPPGTQEIISLRDVVDSPQSKNTRVRTRSTQRSQSTEQTEVAKDINKNRRRSMRLSIAASRENSNRESISKVPLTKTTEITSTDFDPALVIKNEPLSDSEDVVQSDSLNINDIPNLMHDLSGKKRLIVISTNDENDSTSSKLKIGRAKKSFLNKIQVEPKGLEQLPSPNWMICIPAASSAPVSNSQSPPTSNRSTPASDSHISVSHLKPNANSSRMAQSTSALNRPTNMNVPPLSYSNSRQNSLQSSYMTNGQSHITTNHVNEHPTMPSLTPRPQGVFINDGNNFQRDNGPVSRMLADNAHRITDLFNTVLVNTVVAFAPELPAAENVMLRAELEKLNRDMQITKADCQQKMQELRREHQDEIDSLKKGFDERMKNLQMAFDQDKTRVINEVRKQCENEKQRAIEITRRETKKSTWCCNCTKEARFYCCWNTSYCGQQCQKTHWQVHQKYCTNKNSVNETSQSTQQSTSNKQPSNEASTLVTVQSTSASRAPVVLKPPQQLHMQQKTSPVSMQQQHLVLARSQHGSGSGVAKNQQIFTLDRRIMDTLPHNLIIQTIQRENLNNGVLSGNETLILQTSNSITNSAATSSQN